MSDVRRVWVNNHQVRFVALSPEAKEQFVELFADASVEITVQKDYSDELKKELIEHGLTFERD